MASQTLYISPVGLLLQQLSNLGVPLAGGLVYIYVAGSVNTLQTTYTDSTGTTQNANPIVLNSGGRLAASNAPVSVWVPTNTPHKMVLTDATGNLLSGGTCMDNLFGINDPIAILTSLKTATTGSGADLVANAMRSYDVVASVRAANVPVLAGGQTLVIDIEGGSLVNDGNGGLFYWNATSTAVDDGITVIKPAAIVAPAPGRYLRQTNLFGSTNIFQLTVTGCTTAPVLTCHFVQNGNQVTVTIPDTGVLVGALTTFGFSGFPNALQGVTNQTMSPLVAALDNGVATSGFLIIQNQIGGSNVIIEQNTLSQAWTGAGNRRLFQVSFSYVQS